MKMCVPQLVCSGFWRLLLGKISFKEDAAPETFW